jgi:hypothetical protein
MRRLRQWHLYLGILFAPAIIFFAFSGMIQTIGWQDGPAPAAWIRVIAGIHKHQALPRARAERHEDHGPAEHRGPKPGEHHDEHDDSAAIPLKAFVLLVSLGLIASAALGIAIALINRAARRVSWIMLSIGVVLPVALLLV